MKSWFFSLLAFSLLGAQTNEANLRRLIQNQEKKQQQLKKENLQLFKKNNWNPSTFKGVFTGV